MGLLGLFMQEAVAEWTMPPPPPQQAMLEPEDPDMDAERDFDGAAEEGRFAEKALPPAEEPFEEEAEPFDMLEFQRGLQSRINAVRRSADSAVPSPVPAQRNSRGEGRVRDGKFVSADRLNKQYWRHHFTMISIVSLVSAGLLIAAIQTLRLKLSGPGWLIVLLVLALAVEGGQTALGAVVQMEMFQAMTAAFEELRANSDKSLPEAAMFAGIMRASAVAGVIFAAGIFLVKAALYVVTALYMRRERVAALFQDAVARG